MAKVFERATLVAAFVATLSLGAHAAQEPVRFQAGAFVKASGAYSVGVVQKAMEFLGVMYREGGNDPTGFDCSGFIQYLYGVTHGIALPRRAEDQALGASAQAVQRDQLRPGDLVFFSTLSRTYSHVGLYLGNGKFIHAPSTGGSVRIDEMRNVYWSPRFSGARRIV